MVPAGSDGAEKNKKVEPEALKRHGNLPLI